MANGNNFISLYGAIDANGYPITPNSPMLQDISPANLAIVITETVNDFNGNPRDCFKLFYASPKNLSYSYFFLPVTAELPDLATFLTALQGLNATSNAANLFSLYTNLESINDAPQIPATKSFIANDSLTYSRIYNPGTNNTDLYICIVNNLQYDKWTVSGDQSIAGDYTYFGV